MCVYIYIYICIYICIKEALLKYCFKVMCSGDRSGCSYSSQPEVRP